MSNDESYMRLALNEARRGGDAGEIPVGAVVVLDNRVIAAAHNMTVGLTDPTAHAEILAIRAAALSLGRERLQKCTLYVTLEPCAMCAGAIVNARIPRLVFGAHDIRAGAAVTLYSIVHDDRLNHCCDTTGGLLDNAALELLQGFFRDRRSSSSSS